MTTVHTSEQLGRLRQLMKESAVDIYVVPSEDSHQSEYIAPCDARRSYISGFNGSAGTAVITGDKAALATDGRYFNQASKQLDENWELLKQGQEKVPTWQEWTAKAAAGGKVVGVDPNLITAGDAKKLDEKIKQEGGDRLQPVMRNLVDVIWGGERPGRPKEPVKVLDVKYAGKALEEKLEDLRIELDKINSPGLVVNMLDEIAWLFNLRGSDIPYNPVFFSYAFVGKQSASLYIDSSQLDKAGISHLGDKVEVKPYDTIYSDLKTFAEQHAKSLSATGDEATAAKRRKAEKFLVGKRVSWSLSKALGGEDAVEEVRSPIGNAKAVKNETELAGMRAGHVRDGAAITEYFSWLEHELKAGKRKITEVSGADKLLEIRQKMDLFVGLSFPTISSAGPNAAVIHYQPEPETCADISLDGIYLCDCGVQCLDSTTDTTRTVHFGTPTAAERRAYTLVLKGHIALDRAVFPKGTSGMSLDVLARQFLWSEDVYDVPHGIGHGIGSYLNVHEGPISISSRPASAEVPLAAGNVLSNEPGYYEDGKFGVRIENAVLVVPAGRKEREGGKPFFKFEKVTMVPMCRHLLDLPLLTPQEVTWLNDYHVDVLQKTKGHFEERVAKGDESAKIALAWLQKETAPL